MPEEILFKDLPQEELRRLQLKLTDILNEFDNFCKEHNLTYFLSAGTCLGAVRHKGFIPWDDDLDVALPRKDYEILSELWNKYHPDGRYVLCRPSKDVLTGVHITQIKDSTTTCLYGYSNKYKICQGIKIDVEPLDGAPDNRLLQFIQAFNANLYGLFAAQRVPTHYQPTWKKVVARIVSPIFTCKRICYYVFSNAEEREKKYNLDKCSKVKFNFGPVYEKSMFIPATMLEFEGRKRPVPNKYHEYLSMLYGDYMSLPPANKRYPISKVLLLDLDRGYTDRKTM